MEAVAPGLLKSRLSGVPPAAAPSRDPAAVGEPFDDLVELGGAAASHEKLCSIEVSSQNGVIPHILVGYQHSPGQGQGPSRYLRQGPGATADTSRLTLTATQVLTDLWVGWNSAGRITTIQARTTDKLTGAKEWRQLAGMPSHNSLLFTAAPHFCISHLHGRQDQGALGGLGVYFSSILPYEWTPANNATYPAQFKAAVRTLLLCNHHLNRLRAQAAPAVGDVEERATDVGQMPGDVLYLIVQHLNLVCYHEFTAADSAGFGGTRAEVTQVQQRGYTFVPNAHYSVRQYFTSDGHLQDKPRASGGVWVEDAAVPAGWRFWPDHDSIGSDIACMVGATNLAQMVASADRRGAIAFNTDGFLKNALPVLRVDHDIALRRLSNFYPRRGLFTRVTDGVPTDRVAANGGTAW